MRFIFKEDDFFPFHNFLQLFLLRILSFVTLKKIPSIEKKKSNFEKLHQRNYRLYSSMK